MKNSKNVYLGNNLKMKLHMPILHLLQCKQFFIKKTVSIFEQIYGFTACNIE